MRDTTFSTWNSFVFLVFFSSCLTKMKPFSLLLIHFDSLPWESHEKLTAQSQLWLQGGCRLLVTSCLCGRSPAHAFRRCRSVCSAGASWDTGAWKRWAGRWCSREAGCCYWSHCGSHCPCRPRRCPDPRLFTQTQRETGQWEGERREEDFGSELYHTAFV